MDINYFTDKLENQEHDRKRRDDAEAAKRIRSSYSLLVSTLTDEQWESLDIDTSRENFTQLDEGVYGFTSLIVFKTLDDQRATGEVWVAVEPSIRSSGPYIKLADHAPRKLYYAGDNSNREAANNIIIAEEIRKGLAAWPEKMATGKRKNFQRLKSNTMHPNLTREAIEEIKKDVANSDLLKEDRAELESQMADYARIADKREEQAAKLRYEARHQARDIISAAKKAAEERDAWLVELKAWAERETERLWEPWAVELVSYYPNFSLANYEESSGDNFEETAYIYLDEEYRRMSEKGYLIEVNRLSGYTKLVKLTVELRAELVEFKNPNVEDHMTCHRTYGNGPYLVNVPAGVEEEPSPAPERPPRLRDRMQELQVGALSNRALNAIYDSYEKAVAAATVDQIVDGEIKRGGVNEFEDVPF